MDSLVDCSICTNLRPAYVPVHINDNGSVMVPNPLHANSPMCASCLITRYDAVEQCPICRGRFQCPADVLAERDEEADRLVAEQMPFRNTANVFEQPIVAQAVEAVRNSRRPRRVNRIARRPRATQRTERQPEEVVIPEHHCDYRSLRATTELPNAMCLETVFNPSTVDGKNYCENHFVDGPYEMMLRAQMLENQKLEKSAKNKKRIADSLLKEQTKKAQLMVMQSASVGYFNHLGQASGALSNFMNPQPVPANQLPTGG